MFIDSRLLDRFERGLNPQDLNNSPIPASVIGYGEISAIFEIADNRETAFKRLPLFQSRESAETYTRQFHEYCGLLTAAGLSLPEHETCIIEAAGRPVVVYIAQKKQPAERFGHRLIHTLEANGIRQLIERIVLEIASIWRFNRAGLPDIELAIDGQLSNWVWLENGGQKPLYYIDTSTPLFRQQGAEQLDPELFLQSAPAFLRWILRLLFVQDVINRYYDQRQVYIDLTANLIKEQRPDLVVPAVDIINRRLAADQMPLSVREVTKYYREDKLIWTLFLAFRRLDRWITTQVFRRRYEFILPGKIKR